MTKQALYLKWRPAAFDDVIGQEHVTRTLLNSISTGRIRHAYLFSGPRGTGKTTTARLLAHALGSKNMDLIEIDAASHTGVDDVRDLRDKIQFMPSEGQYKVYIIDEVHRFSGSAFDALLKTLEEPPDHAIFVLATTEIDKVPDTIKSRCLQFEFRRVALREVADRLQFISESEGFNIDRDALELVARYGTGSVRDSISLLDQIVADPEEHITLALAQKILGTANNESVQHLADAVLRGDPVAGLRLINEAVDGGSDPRQFGGQVVEHLRHVLLAQTASADLIEASDEMREVFTRQASLVDKPTLLRCIRAFNDAVNDQRSSWQPQLALELALVESTQGREALAEPGTVASEGNASTVDAASLRLQIEAAVAAQLAGMSLAREVATGVDSEADILTQTVTDPEPLPEAQSDLGEPALVPLSAIRSKWGEVTHAVRGRSQILSALLDHVEPRTVNGDVVTLAAKNDVFLERVNTSEHRSLLNFVLTRLHGEKLQVRVVMTSDDVFGGGAGVDVDDPFVA
ncbi:MAG: DNA polymerase III subunit gamma/tau, partial [Chloroflexota bacterium]